MAYDTKKTAREIGFNYGSTCAESDIASRPRTRANLTASATNTVLADLMSLVDAEFPEEEQSVRDYLYSVALVGALDAWATFRGIYES